MLNFVAVGQLSTLQ